MHGQTGADALPPVVQVFKLAQEPAKALIVVKFSMRDKIVYDKTASILGQAGVNVLFRVVRVLKDARGLAKEIIAVKICMIVKIVINLTV